ncbi:MAG TPA: S9 family peptidase, partial [Sphingomicrobium sp.]|nr:S9 family peptidase [Sphingomicrobium sp.]
MMNKVPSLPAPPRAEQRPFSYERHGVTVEDPWAWLRDQNYPDVQDEDVLAYLKAENEYFEAAMAPHKELTDQLFEEMKGRIKEDDSSVPIKDGDWLYWWAFKPGTQYRDWYRRPATGGDEALIYSENAEAEGKEYYRLGAFAVSPDGKLLATLVDDDGSERFKLVVRDLATGQDIETVTKVGIGNPVWTSDSKGIVFTEVNDQWRSYRAQYHRIGDDPANAVTLYEEKDDIAFSVGAARSTDDSLIFISTGNNSSNEIRFVPADDPASPLVLITPRRPEIQYEADAAHGKLWILTND